MRPVCMVCLIDPRPAEYLVAGEPLCAHHAARQIENGWGDVVPIEAVIPQRTRNPQPVYVHGPRQKTVT